MLLIAPPVRINTNDIVIIVFGVAEVEPLLNLLSLTRAYRLENAATAEQASSDPRRNKIV